MTDSDVWDPDPLQPGDRVRVRLNGECADLDCAKYPHLDGVTGTVAACPYPDTEHIPGHTVPVRFDDRQPGRLMLLGGACFARAELERVDGAALVRRALGSAAGRAEEGE